MLRRPDRPLSASGGGQVDPEVAAGDELLAPRVHPGVGPGVALGLEHAPPQGLDLRLDPLLRGCLALEDLHHRDDLVELENAG